MNKENKKKDYSDLCRFIIEQIGGRENVKSLTHCVTRLRFVLKDESLANDELIENHSGVVSVVKKGGQYQIVIGSHVTDVYDTAMQQLGLSENFSETEAENSSPVGFRKKAVDIISGTFWPFLGTMCATGIIKGILGALSYFGILSAASGTYTILYALADSFFYFLPIMIAITLSDKLKMNRFTAVTLAFAMVCPTIVNLAGSDVLGTIFQGVPLLKMNYYIKFLGIPVVLPPSGYTSSVFPIMLGLLVASVLEKKLEKILPSLVKSFLVPTLVLIIMCPLIFIVIGPIAYILSNIVGAVFSAAFNIPGIGGAIGGMLIGGFWQVFVMLGLHFGITPLAIVNLTSLGYDFLIAPNFGCCFATAASVLAMYIKTKDQKLKSAAMPAFVSSICGVTEPAIYGITLPRTKVFVITCIASAAGGFVMGLQKCFLYVAGGSGIFGFTNFIDVNNINPDVSAVHGVIWAVVGVVISSVVAFVLTFIMYKDDVQTAVSGNIHTSAEALPKTESSEEESEIFSPLKGTVKKLSDIEDEAFSSGLLGEGIAILPEEGKVYAPCDGTVTGVFPTGHAIGITSDHNVELLIHIGMDTVQLNGNGFHTLVKDGDHIQKGQLLLEFDIEKIKAAGYSTVSPIIVTDVDSCKISLSNKKDVVPGDLIMTVRKAN